MIEDEFNGILKEKAHPRAQELIQDDFFWDYLDELTPFGSDEGHNALVQYREWRQANLDTPIIDCLNWLIEGIGDMNPEDYNESFILSENIIKQLDDEEFDDDYFIYTLDAYLIGVCFGQLADEGKMDADSKEIAKLALQRQLNWASLDESEINLEYIGNIKKLQKILLVA